MKQQEKLVPRAKTSAIKKGKVRKKISSIRNQDSESGKTRKRVFIPIRKSLSDISRSFSEGADKVAGVLIDDSHKERNIKCKRLKEETLSLVADITSGIKRNLKNIEPGDFLCDATYGIGKFFRIAKDGCTKIFDDLIR
ncbi:MAG: hypothetical protein JSW40_07370 [Candidatus Omnitrophota bacterium]|nr:MAG: hypothetical protein JSW40_07370 [Candidatus Omnitrophota bacterium]